MIAIASDHAGRELRLTLLKEDILDLGEDEDYPRIATKMAQWVTQDENRSGILICGSGIGMSIAANRILGIRAACVENPLAAKIAKEHNGANILCLGARFVAPFYAQVILDAWRAAWPSMDERHVRRRMQLDERV